MLRPILALSLCSLMAVPAAAQMSDVTCEDSARLAQKLTTVLGAERQGSGLRDPDTMVEVWVTEHNRDWVIVQSFANGTSCIVAMGAHWAGPGKTPA
ncbi:hypothetical protein JANAI62_11000 [Jannaschia pagri]|uniref:Uncharacterized protein n=2 Tax=Roseobacteraceae TaxID=2854170 RepID=A0ABQ4NJ79_9RHOB|nr:hypothetical protein JANAI62_11000 [Jannaschia sp. AI_62]